MTTPRADTAALSPDVPVWQSCLGTGALDGTGYFEGFNEVLPGLLRRPPRRVLEVGCAGGVLGAHVKERFPGIHYCGIEMNAAAAAAARGRLDRVINKRLEEVDFGAEGIEPGSIDTVFAGDVLEHLYDPWRALVGIRALLTADAQVALCVPNIRNLFVLGQLHNEGTWRYDTHGLLDITHIRFFALRDVVRMMDETGYAVDDVKAYLDPRFEAVFRDNRDKPEVTLQVGHVRLERLTPAELHEYCTLEYLVLAHPKPVPANDSAA